MFSKITDDLNIIQGLSDMPNEEEGISAEQLKAKFDLAGNKIKTAYNGLIDNLTENATGFEASNYITAGKIYTEDTSSNNVQAKLVKLKELINEATVGTIPDNSITKRKLAFEDDLPSLSNMGGLYLASKYVTPTNTGIKETEYVQPTLSSSNKQGYEITGFTIDGEGDIYNLFNKTGEYFTAPSGTNFDLIIKFPNYISFDSIGINAGGMSDDYFSTIYYYGSVDGINYELLSSKYSYGCFWFKAEITNHHYYKYLKIKRTASKSRSKICCNLSITGKVLTQITGTNVLTYTTGDTVKLTSYDNGQIFKIKTPADYTQGDQLPTTLNINNIGAKNLPSDLEPSKRYSLIYDGSKFIHEEE